MSNNILDYIYHIFISYTACHCLDKLATVLYTKLSYIPSYSQNVRWFFIHFVVNLYITIFGFADVKYSLLHISECATTEWTNGTHLYITAVTLHIYHILNFTLNKMDWIHHISMAIISAPLILLYNRTCSSVVGLWFTSGLPGAIDYLLLWLVKMGMCNTWVEKKLYVYINVWLRSPGCIYATILQIPFIYKMGDYSRIEILAKLWLLLILFWNGQFFMHTTLHDYYAKYLVYNNKNNFHKQCTV